MSDLSGRYDNESGRPIFQPELTGDGLRGDDLNDWIDFCTLVATHEEPIYNAYFEKYWRRQEQPRDKCVVRAEATGDDTILIHCPTKYWSVLLLEQMPKLQTLYRKRRFLPIPPTRTGKAPSINPVLTDKQLKQLKIDIATCDRLMTTTRKDGFGKILDNSKYVSMGTIGRGILAKHERAI